MDVLDLEESPNTLDYFTADSFEGHFFGFTILVQTSTVTANNLLLYWNPTPFSISSHSNFTYGSTTLNKLKRLYQLVRKNLEPYRDVLV